MARSKMHAADIATREAIAKATEFSVFQQRFRQRYKEDGFLSLADAALAASRIEQDFGHRPALIYAFVEGIGHPVPNDLRAAASAHLRTSDNDHVK